MRSRNDFQLLDHTRTTRFAWSEATCTLSWAAAAAGTPAAGSWHTDYTSVRVSLFVAKAAAVRRSAGAARALDGKAGSVHFTDGCGAVVQSPE